MGRGPQAGPALAAPEAVGETSEQEGTPKWLKRGQQEAGDSS